LRSGALKVVGVNSYTETRSSSARLGGDGAIMTVDHGCRGSRAGRAT
jgi:hypothetical protein